MKISALLTIAIALGIVLGGCEKDNYDPPSSTLTGRVVFEDQPVGVRSNGVQLELWQPGFQLYQKIPVLVAQDGTFSASLFDGDYKLVLLRGNGPWVDNTDTINIQLRGTKTVDVPVVPYYTIRNEQYARSESTLTATCKVVQVSPSKPIEQVTLYVGATQFVDANNNAVRVDKAGADLADLNQNVSFTLMLPANLKSKGYFYVRIGVKTLGVAEMLYTPVQKMQIE